MMRVVGGGLLIESTKMAGTPHSPPLHTIRLRGAWITANDNSRTCHSRNFGWPKPLDAGDQLWLVCTHVPAAAEVFLNGESVAIVAAAGPVDVDITKTVQPRNTVVFAVAVTGTLGDVTLEVRRSFG